MEILLNCSSGLHTVRLRNDRIWKRALCPKCKTKIDPTRLRRLWLVLRAKVWRTRSRESTSIPDEIRFANLRWRLDKLIGMAWTIDESHAELRIDHSLSHRSSPEEIIRNYLNHINTVAPGFNIPIRIPKISVGSPKDTGGTFGSKDGWAIMTLSKELVGEKRAVAAVLAHEVCHYVLNCSSVREDETEWNEKLTDLCMFVVGLGDVYLSGYRSSKIRGEYRVGHRLGYLSDREYRFAAQYVDQLRRNPQRLQKVQIDFLRNKIASRVGDKRVIERMIENERRLAPKKSELELYRLASESLDKGRV